MAERDTVIPLSSVTTPGRARPEPRQMPHNADAERGLLGALLIDNRAYEKVADFLKVEHFYAPAHGRIYGLIAKLIERGQIASPVTVKPLVHEDEDLAHLGGGGYLADLVASVVTILSVEDYGRAIFDLHLRRQLI